MFAGSLLKKREAEQIIKLLKMEKAIFEAIKTTLKCQPTITGTAL